MFVRLFQIKVSESLEKRLAGAIFTKTKNGETDTKRALDYSRMPKLQKYSQQLPSCVIATRDS